MSIFIIFIFHSKVKHSEKKLNGTDTLPEKFHAYKIYLKLLIFNLRVR